MGTGKALKPKIVFSFLLSFSSLNLVFIPMSKSYALDSPYLISLKEAANRPETWPTPPIVKYKRASKTRENLAIIMFSGLFGSVLGLSTVSFYPQPEKALSNITTGFAFGIFSGVLFVTYQFFTQEYKDGYGSSLRENFYKKDIFSYRSEYKKSYERPSRFFQRQDLFSFSTMTSSAFFDSFPLLFYEWRF